MSHHVVYLVVVFAIALIVGVSMLTHSDNTRRLYSSAISALSNGNTAALLRLQGAAVAAADPNVDQSEQLTYVRDALSEGIAWCRRAQNEANLWAFVLVLALLVFMVLYHFVGRSTGKR